MQPNTLNTHHDTDPHVPPELLEALARALAAALIPPQVCAACPVRQPCLDYAITNRISDGIWGGLTERERRALQSRWVRASRRDRDRAIRAAEAAGYTAAAIGRSFGLSRTSVSRVLARDEDRRRS
jgi:hypothetical protein